MIALGLTFVSGYCFGVLSLVAYAALREYLARGGNDAAQ